MMATTAKGLPYPFHPACAIFPVMPPDELQELADDIRAHGLREAITLYEDQIVDGRNRLLACLAASIEPHYEPWDGRGTVVEFVISRNLRRRHLTFGQRVGLAARLVPMLAEEAKTRVGGRPPKEKPPTNSAGVTGEAAALAAKRLDVGRTVVREVLAEQKHDPTIIDALISGKTTVPALRRKALQRKTGAAIAAAAMELDQEGITVTGDPVVVRCEAVIAEPPEGIGEQRWDAAVRRAFTLAWGGAWSGCGAEAVVVLCRQEVLFEMREWLDTALTNYELQHVLALVEKGAPPPATTSGFTPTWQPVLVYGWRGRGPVAHPTLLGGAGRELVFRDSHIIQTAAIGNASPAAAQEGKPASVYDWLISAVSIRGARVANPFHLSQTAARAVRNLGRDYHGVKFEATVRAYSVLPTAATPHDHPVPRRRFPARENAAPHPGTDYQGGGGGSSRSA